MQTKNGLFRLVKAMSPSEISYFRKYARLYSQKKKPNYLKIFEEIRKQDAYEEVLILKKFKKERFVTNFSVAKKDLKEKVLEALRSYNSGQRKDDKLRKMMDTLPIYHDKRLFLHLKRTLNAARKIAEEQRWYPFLLEINRWDQKVIFLSPAKKHLEILERLEGESEWLLAKMQALKRMENQCHKLLHLLNNDFVLRDPTQYAAYLESAKNDLENIDVEELPMQYKVLFFRTLGLTKHMENEPEAALSIYEQLVQLVAPETAGIQYVQTYKKALCDYVNAAFKADKMELAGPVLQKMQELTANASTEDAEAFNITSFLGLIYYLNAEKWEQARALIGHIEKYWPLHQAKIKTGRKLAFYYNIFVFYFVMEEWEAALPWLEKILRQANVSERSDIQGAARILQLVVFYELEDWDNLENRLSSGSRNLKKNNQFLSFEAEVIKFFEQLILVPEKKQSENLLTAFLAALEELAEHPIEKKALGLVELLFWCRKKEPML